MIGLLELLARINDNEAQRVKGAMTKILTPERVAAANLSADSTTSLILLGIWIELLDSKQTVEIQQLSDEEFRQRLANVFGLNEGEVNGR